MVAPLLLKQKQGKCGNRFFLGKAHTPKITGKLAVYIQKGPCQEKTLLTAYLDWLCLKLFGRKNSSLFILSSGRRPLETQLASSQSFDCTQRGLLVYRRILIIFDRELPSPKAFGGSSGLCLVARCSLHVWSPVPELNRPCGHASCNKLQLAPVQHDTFSNIFGGHSTNLDMREPFQSYCILVSVTVYHPCSLKLLVGLLLLWS